MCIYIYIYNFIMYILYCIIYIYIYTYYRRHGDWPASKRPRFGGAQTMAAQTVAMGMNYIK